jgi:hypothetical protein
MIVFEGIEFLALSRLGSGWPGPAPSPDFCTSGGDSDAHSGLGQDGGPPAAIGEIVSWQSSSLSVRLTIAGTAACWSKCLDASQVLISRTAPGPR